MGLLLAVWMGVGSEVRVAPVIVGKVTKPPAVSGSEGVSVDTSMSGTLVAEKRG